MYMCVAHVSSTCVWHMSHVHVCGTYLLYMCVAHVSNTGVALHLYCHRREDVAVRMCVRVDCVCNGRRFCDAVRTCTCVWHRSLVHILAHVQVCGTGLLHTCVAHIAYTCVWHMSYMHVCGTHLLYMCVAHFSYTYVWHISLLDMLAHVSYPCVVLHVYCYTP